MSDDPEEYEDEEVEEVHVEPEFTVDLDNLPKQGHIWINRGEKMSCENAGHPYHQAFKRRPR